MLSLYFRVPRNWKHMLFRMILFCLISVEFHLCSSTTFLTYGAEIKKVVLSLSCVKNFSSLINWLRVIFPVFVPVPIKKSMCYSIWLSLISIFSIFKCLQVIGQNIFFKEQKIDFLNQNKKINLYKSVSRTANSLFLPYTSPLTIWTLVALHHHCPLYFITIVFTLLYINVFWIFLTYRTL